VQARVQINVMQQQIFAFDDRLMNNINTHSEHW